MTEVQLTEAFFAKIAGWEAIKRARHFIEQGAVLSSNWTPPLLKGVVQDGPVSYRAGLVIKDTINLENICRCRPSQDWGAICAHSVAVGLHHLRNDTPSGSPTQKANHPASPIESLKGPVPVKAGKRLRRAGPDDPAETVEMTAILPPNFEAALSKGKVMVCFEAQWSRGRTPLNALPLSNSYRFSAGDSTLLDAIEELGGGDTPGMLMLNVNAFTELLKSLLEHPRVRLGRAQDLQVKREPWRPPLSATLQKSGVIRLEVRAQMERIVIIPGSQSWAFHAHTFQPIELPPGCRELWKSPVTFARHQVPIFLNRDWPLLQKAADLKANFQLSDFILEPQAPRFLLSLTGGLAQLQGQLQCRYGTRIMTVGVTPKDEALWLPDPDNPTRYSTRDLAAEQAAADRLLRSGFTGPDAQGRYQALGQNLVLQFFASVYPRLTKEWEVTLEERLGKSTSQNLEWIEPRLGITSSGEQWFDLDVSFASQSGERFSTSEIQRLVLSGQSHSRLKNGRFALIDTGAVEELQEVLLDCAPQQHAGVYRMQSNQAGFLESTVRRQLGWQVQAPSHWRERAAKQSGESVLPIPPLGSLEEVLRPYQKEGVAWLWFLRENKFGGILADEMGLGKTLQTLAYLQAARQRRQEGSVTIPIRPSLVVCPTSLVFNWEAEARRFTPDLKVISIRGANRRPLIEKLSQSDLAITSYALIRRDAELYREYEFDTLILDEAQHIKNRQTQNAQAVKTVRAENRFVLTGTPLENSVLDLWSIFDFLMPGYLGSAKDFHERYEIPITREKSSEAQTRLARRVRPFLLRRLKREVATDLPDKIEQVSFCEMTEDQKAAYQQVLEVSRREVLESVAAQGEQKSRMVVLTALLRLRQICCDLRLLKLEDIDPAKASGKVELFSELLAEVLDGGHRVLVFSQFVQMLSLLKEKLRAEGVEHLYLDGSTQDRGAVVQEFQSNPNFPVFLISLKAGGVGLNLTGADTVIHFDPWWNPAIEAQATDRAHRIGQAKVVTSYKLITRGTVEEKILHLQNRKRELTAAMLSGEEEFAKALSWEEIQGLLAD